LKAGEKEAAANKNLGAEWLYAVSLCSADQSVIIAK
jgi:hypothetical protein